MDLNDASGGASNGENAKCSASIPGKDDDRKLFVGGLSRQTTNAELQQYFSKFGQIESVTVKVDPYTGQSRGFAFIVFSNADSIETLLNSGDHYINRKRVDPKRVSKDYGKIFVGGLTPQLTDEDVKEYFSQYGNVVEIKTPCDDNNHRRAFCFVTFDSKDVAVKMLKTPQQVINGVKVDVKKVLKDNANNPQQQGYATPAWAVGGYPGSYCVQGLLDFTDPRSEFVGYEYGIGNAPPDADFGIPNAGKGRGNVGKYQRH